MERRREDRLNAEGKEEGCMEGRNRGRGGTRLYERKKTAKESKEGWRKGGVGGRKE